MDDFHIFPALEHAQLELGRPLRALIPVEIGGSNALIPLCVAGKAKLPVFDGDLLGRAFPAISLISTNLYGILPHRAYICDPSTGKVNVLEVNSYEELEAKARAQAIQQRATTAVLVPIVLTAQEARRAVIQHTISRAIEIGGARSVDTLCAAIHGTIWCVGIVTAWKYQVVGGFLVGTINIQTSQNEYYTVHVKNEYLMLCKKDDCIARAPDIIALIDVRTALSILSDQLHVGTEVVCVTCAGPDVWYTPRGMELVASRC